MKKETEETFEGKLHRISGKSLDMLERVIEGDASVEKQQAVSAATVLSARFKQDSTINGRARNMISLIKLGIREPEMREVVARQVLASLGVQVPQLASGEVVAKTQ
jgi:hypothetical protein